MTHGDGGVPEAGGMDMQPDVERIHRAIRREPGDPVEGRERVPWFFTATVALALFWGGWYLGKFGGTFDRATHVEMIGRDPGTRREVAKQTAQALADPVAAGEAVYAKHCASCHQGNGLGIPNAFPPLIGSAWVTGTPETLVRILLHGLQGPVTVAGANYNGAMPAWGGVLQDAEIAAVATYVRQWSPNAAAAVDVALVARERSAAPTRTPWTAAELLP